MGGLRGVLICEDWKGVFRFVWVMACLVTHFDDGTETTALLEKGVQVELRWAKIAKHLQLRYCSAERGKEAIQKAINHILEFTIGGEKYSVLGRN